MFSRTGHEDAYVGWWLEKEKTREDRDLEIDGIKLHCPRGIFTPDPDMTFSSSLMLSAMETCEGKHVLDMGTGSGLLAIAAAKKGASSVLATDYNAACVAAARDNMARNAVEDRVSVRQADLFDGVKGQFDLVVANLPFSGGTWPQLGDGVPHIHARFLQALPAYLAPGGVCHFAFASFGDLEGLAGLLAATDLAVTATERRAFDINWQLVTLQKT